MYEAQDSYKQGLQKYRFAYNDTNFYVIWQKPRATFV